MRARRTVPLLSALLAMFAVLTVLVVAGVALMQNHQRAAATERAAAVSLDALDAYVSDMDKSFESLETFLLGYFIDNGDVAAFTVGQDASVAYRAKQNIARTLDQVVRLGGIAECAWLLAPTAGGPAYLARCAFTGVSYAELVDMREYLVGLHGPAAGAAVLENPEGSDAVSSDLWTPVTVGGVEYYLWTIPLQDMRIGAWVRVSRLYERFGGAFPEYGGGSVALAAAAEGRILANPYAVGDDEPGAGLGASYAFSDCAFSDCAFSDARELIVSEGGQGWALTGDGAAVVASRSSRADLAVMAALPVSGIADGPGNGSDIAMFAAGLAVFVLIAALVFQSLMYRPFARLEQRLRDIAGGNLDIRIVANSRLREISTLERSINRLLDVIGDLKISVYETQLDRRNVAIQYLRIRLKTHFYLNCLSIIHAMARVGKTAQIKELTLCLSRYLRFLDKDTEETVRLEEELSHARNYARIQEMRFPGLFSYTEDVEAGLGAKRIPPLVLQTFIENSVEHAVARGRENWVRLEATAERRDGGPGVRYRVTDSGDGFSLTALAALAELDASGGGGRDGGRVGGGRDGGTGGAGSLSGDGGGDGGGTGGGGVLGGRGFGGGGGNVGRLSRDSAGCLSGDSVGRLSGGGTGSLSGDGGTGKGEGIRNAVGRLALIYDGRASVRFSNAESGGAAVDMWLPDDSPAYRRGSGGILAGTEEKAAGVAAGAEGTR